MAGKPFVGTAQQRRAVYARNVYRPGTASPDPEDYAHPLSDVREEAREREHLNRLDGS